MARTDRPSGGTPATAAAMDELNLDDLFLGGGDGGGDDLFGGLDDIDLGGFDEISSAGGGTNAASGRRRGGDAAAAAVAAATFDGIDFDLSSSASFGTSASASTMTPTAKKSQRKKRKTKKMLASENDAGDESDEDFFADGGSLPSTTKVASRGKGGARKRKAAFGADTPPILPSASAARGKGKAKKGAGTATTVQPFGSSPTMPPPLPRPGPGGVMSKYLQGSAVFASGQLPIQSPPPVEVKKTAAKKRRKSGNTDGSGAASSSGPRVDPTFCGLAPNSTMFYPFMPVPSEVSMKRLNKVFPLLEKVHTHLGHLSDEMSGTNSGGGSTPISNGGASLGNNALFRLFVDHLDALDNSHAKGGAAAEAATANGSVAPGASSGNARAHKHLNDARKLTSGAKRSKLREELVQALMLARRQAAFLGASVQNMEAWCKQNFSAEDYVEGFMDEPLAPHGSTQHGKGGRSGSIDKASSSILPAVKSMVPVHVKIRVKCKGFREPAAATAKLGGGPLVARLPVPPEVVRAAAASAAAGGTSSKRRRKSTTASSSDAVPSVPYEYLTPSERRCLIARAISTQAYDLEAKRKETKEKRKASQKECVSKIGQIIKDDPVEVCHTAALWKILKHSPYLSDLNEEDVREGLAEAWQPELGCREIHWGEIPPIRIQRARVDVPSKKRKRETKEFGKNGGGPATMPPSKLFDRLQSLLVDVGKDDDNGDDEESSAKMANSELPNERASSYASDPRIKPPVYTLAKSEGETVLDLSKFTLDQRAYIQLRSLGLADVPLLPAVLPIVEEETFEHSNRTPAEGNVVSKASISNGEHRLNAATVATSQAAELVKSDGETPDDDLDVIVRRMQSDLSGVHCSNNVRAALLQAAAVEQLYGQRQAKRRDEDNASLVAKHAQLIKKRKEAQIKNAPKPPASKDEGWLPW